MQPRENTGVDPSRNDGRIDNLERRLEDVVNQLADKASNDKVAMNLHKKLNKDDYYD